MWRRVFMQPPPLDFLQADEALDKSAVAAAHSAMAMWTLEHCYPMLPYSAVVLESVAESEVPPAHLPLPKDLKRLTVQINGAGRNGSTPRFATGALPNMRIHRVCLLQDAFGMYISGHIWQSVPG